ncbi:hypothetical protein L2E82_47121 [Cichorium intybus]|uniref:Uncharacterized protein n=1 Tax=Cichorium intybus TaxID=13427 RepID=A0ACB8YVM0_CICIN|nr:hypothetical protein L2E82_47121 [Cichorium intybus]
MEQTATMALHASIEFLERDLPDVNDRRKIESFVREASELAIEEERGTDHSGISHVGDQSSGIEYNGAYN